MKAIDEQIKKNKFLSYKYKSLYLDDKVSFEKSKELREKQDIAYHKMLFFEKLKKEMFK